MTCALLKGAGRVPAGIFFYFQQLWFARDLGNRYFHRGSYGTGTEYHGKSHISTRTVWMREISIFLREPSGWDHENDICTGTGNKIFAVKSCRKFPGGGGGPGGIFPRMFFFTRTTQHRGDLREKNTENVRKSMNRAVLKSLTGCFLRTRFRF